MTDEEKQKRYEGSQKRKIFQKYVTYVLSDFRIAQLIEDEVKPGGVSFRINKTGLELLESKHGVITKKTLKRFGDYSSLSKTDLIDQNKDEEKRSEEENIDEYLKQFERRIQLELLRQIKNQCTSKGFEKLCLKLFEEMGYGETKHTGKSGDLGVDGIISEDKLGLRQIYVQTKKHENLVPSDEIYKFAGKCGRDKVSGIFVTTSDFTKDSIEEMEKEPLIKLINGDELTKYLYEYNVGIALDQKIELKQINIDELESFN